MGNAVLTSADYRTKLNPEDQKLCRFVFYGLQLMKYDTVFAVDFNKESERNRLKKKLVGTRYHQLYCRGGMELTELCTPARINAVFEKEFHDLVYFRELIREADPKKRMGQLRTMGDASCTLGFLVAAEELAAIERNYERFVEVGEYLGKKLDGMNDKEYAFFQKINPPLPVR